MREKIVTGFYSALSAGVWFFAFCGILFLVYLLATGYQREPTFAVRSAELTAAAADDLSLLRLGESPEGWYKLSLSFDVRAGALSPYTYAYTGMHLRGPSSLRYGSRHFMVCDRRSFSYADPARVNALLYIQYDGSPEALGEALGNASVAFDDLFMRMGFLEGELLSGAPSIPLSGVEIKTPAAGA